MTALAFVVPDDLERPTGGNRYDQALADALTQLGTQVELRTAPGAWPVATAADRAGLATRLAAPGPVLVDGLVACGAPDQVAAAVAAGHEVHVLVHMPLALDTGLTAGVAAARDALEGAALRAASGVIATSEWTATDLRARHCLSRVTVAAPGTRPAPAARGSDPPMLLQLAAVSPVKNQVTVVQSLSLLADERWTARLTGALDVAPDYAAAVASEIDGHGLTDRVTLTGPLSGAALDQVWDACDVLLLPSYAETWGLAVTEGLARGIPAIVSRGTGAAEALGQAPDGELPGALVDPRSPQALADAIRDLLGAGRPRARRAAAQRRPLLPGWPQTAHAVQTAIRTAGPPAASRVSRSGREVLR